MNRLFSVSVVLAVMIWMGPSAAWATGPASLYKVRVSLFELYNGTSWVTIFSGTSTTLDIASTSSGSTAGNFFAGQTVPDGVYTQSRVTVSPVFIISGHDGASYTTAANGPGTGCVVGAVAAEAACTVTLTGGNVPAAETDTFSSPITVQDGVADRKVRVSFNVSNSIQLIAGELFPAAPTVTVSLQ
jgi:hypothetical protein